MARRYSPHTRPELSAAQALARAWSSGGRLVVLIAILLPLAFMQSSSISAAGPPQLARDTFSRTTSSSWGSADVGGAYALLGTAANYSVSNGTGNISLPTAGVTRAATLTSVSATDVDLTTQFTVDALSTGGGLYLYTDARYVDPNTQYRGKIRLAPDGSVYLHASRVVSGTQTALGSEIKVAGLTYSPGVPIWVRARFTGTSPTTIQLKAWTGSEPATWTYTSTDSTAALQVAGGVGVRAWLASTATAAATVHWDELTVEQAP